MAFQHTVHECLAPGKPGERFDTSLFRSAPFLLSGPDDAPILPGRACTLAGEGRATAGGSGKPLGILCASAYAAPGMDASSGLAVGTFGEIADKGRLIVRTESDARVGQAVLFRKADGAIMAEPEGALPDGWLPLPGAAFVFYDANAGELAVIEL